MTSVDDHLDRYPTGPETDVTQQAVITFNTRTPNVGLHKKHENGANSFPGQVNDTTMFIRPAQALFFIRKDWPLEDRYQKKRLRGEPTTVISTFNALPKFGDTDFDIRKQVHWGGFTKVTWIPGLNNKNSHTASHISLQRGGSGTTPNNSNGPLNIGDAITYEYPSLDEAVRSQQYKHLHSLDDVEKNFVPIVKVFDPAREALDQFNHILQFALTNVAKTRPNEVQAAILDRTIPSLASQYRIPKHLMIAGADLHKFGSSAFVNHIRLAIEIGLVTEGDPDRINEMGNSSGTKTSDFLLNLATKLSLINMEPQNEKYKTLANRILMETFIGNYIRHPQLSDHAKSYMNDNMFGGLKVDTSNDYIRSSFGPKSTSRTDSGKLSSVWTNASSDFINSLYYFFVSAYDKKVGVVIKGAQAGKKFDYVCSN